MHAEHVFKQSVHVSQKRGMDHVSHESYDVFLIAVQLNHDYPAKIYMCHTSGKHGNGFYTFPLRHDSKSQIEDKYTVDLWVDNLGFSPHDHRAQVAAILFSPSLNKANGKWFSYSDVLRRMHSDDPDFGQTVSRYFYERIDPAIQRHLNDHHHSVLNQVLKGKLAPILSHLDGILRKCRPPLKELATLDTGVWSLYVREALTRIHTETNLNIQKPEGIPIACIAERFLPYAKYRVGNASFHIVQGVDAKLLPLAPSAHHAVVQVASQFNFLESLGPYHMPILNYFHDMTQGPQASLGSLAALFVRDKAFQGANPQPLFAHLPPSQYQHGYLYPHKMSPDEQHKFLSLLQEEGGQLRILAQWGIPELASGKPMLQVFTAAPSYQYANHAPHENSLEALICNFLVVSQYTAIAQLTVLRSLLIDRVSLHLTLVGQGVFKNPRSVLQNALQAVMDIVQSYNVDVYIHGFSKKDVEKIHTALPHELSHIRTLSSDEFLQHKLNA